jgi:acyl-[acyl-carrier-protein]-phospholipid O-acyltransferase/long-chain-fatty-acid--[acyl-carrier-protein] ligase
MRSIIRFILKNLFQLLFRVRVSGLDKNIDTSKLLVIANHESFLDGLLLGLYLPFDPVFVVHTGVTHSFFFRMILSMVDYLAVDPTSPMAIKRIIKLVESGRPVVIFPEGRITQTGSLMKVYDGQHLLRRRRARPYCQCVWMALRAPISAVCRATHRAACFLALHSLPWQRR